MGTGFSQSFGKVLDRTSFSTDNFENDIHDAWVKIAYCRRFYSNISSDGTVHINSAGFIICIDMR